MTTVLLDPKDAAERLRLSPATLARWRWAGISPPYRRIGGRVVYPENELEQWIASQPLQSSTSAGTSRGRRGGNPRQRDKAGPARRGD